MGSLPLKRKQLVYAVCGFKKTGKTTLVSGVVRLLTGRGYQVAVIKHDGHDFEGDVPGTDSWQHMAAGAYGTAVFSEGHYLVHKKNTSISAEALMEMFPEADIILIEGMKDCTWPKYYCRDAAASADAIPYVVDEIERLYKERYRRADA